MPLRSPVCGQCNKHSSYFGRKKNIFVCCRHPLSKSILPDFCASWVMTPRSSCSPFTFALQEGGTPWMGSPRTFPGDPWEPALLSFASTALLEVRTYADLLPFVPPVPVIQKVLRLARSLNVCLFSPSKGFYLHPPHCV